MKSSDKTRAPACVSGAAKRLARGGGLHLFWASMAQRGDELRNSVQSRAVSFVDEMLTLVAFTSYLRRVLHDPQIMDYLRSKHPETLRKLERVLSEIESQVPSQGGKIKMWTIAKARKQLRDVITQARQDGPQVIGNGTNSFAVVISASRWKAILKKHPELEDFARPQRKSSALKAKASGANGIGQQASNGSLHRIA